MRYLQVNQSCIYKTYPSDTVNNNLVAVKTVSFANDHTTLNTSVLVRSPKLSSVGRGQYLDGGPLGNTACCWHPNNNNFLLFFIIFPYKTLKSAKSAKKCKKTIIIITIEWKMICVSENLNAYAQKDTFLCKISKSNGRSCRV